jgi:hypothetical protein
MVWAVLLAVVPRRRFQRAITSRGHVKAWQAHGPGTDKVSLKSTTVLRLLHLHLHLPLFAIPPFTMKRAREDYDGSEEKHPAKVRRVVKLDRLSKLSDELLVRILSFVPVNALLVCQR